MKKPIFSEKERHSWYAPGIEIAKLKFRREFEKSSLGRLISRFNYYLYQKLTAKRDA